MNTIRIDVNGPSYRQKVARDRATSRGATIPDDATNDREDAE